MFLLSIQYDQVFSGVIISIIAQFIIFIAIVVYKGGFKAPYEAIINFVRYFKVFTKSGVVAVIPSRKDYAKIRGSQNGKISSFIKQAKKELVITGISFQTGVAFEGIQESFEELISNNVSITISLLNPRFKSGIDAIAPCFNKKVKVIRNEISHSLEILYSFKNNLSQDQSSKFDLRVHNFVPFASAILIDVISKDSDGLIQLETKSYKAPLDSSWGIHIKGKNKVLYKSLKQSWKEIISDTEVFDPEKHLLGR